MTDAEARALAAQRFPGQDIAALPAFTCRLCHNRWLETDRVRHGLLCRGAADDDDGTAELDGEDVVRCYAFDAVGQGMLRGRNTAVRLSPVP